MILYSVKQIKWLEQNLLEGFKVDYDIHCSQSMHCGMLSNSILRFVYIGFYLRWGCLLDDLRIGALSLPYRCSLMTLLSGAEEPRVICRGGVLSNLNSSAHQEGESHQLSNGGVCPVRAVRSESRTGERQPALLCPALDGHLSALSGSAANRRPRLFGSDGSRARGVGGRQVGHLDAPRQLEPCKQPIHHHDLLPLAPRRRWLAT